ncbi:MAG: type I-B CRISPR-associated protein Cas5 [Bacteroidales bacterium]|nr:type I-B CRISPR-associated protein Cas5 [Bacteroidales bacterium]
MNYKEILIFDISSEYGHFRKYNTTTSPLTYSIPTRTAIAGVLGAILGMEREISIGVYPEGVIPVQEFFSKQNSDIAIQIINPVKKENVGINLINTKTSFCDLTKAGRTQIEFELLKDLKFRIFVSLNNDINVFNDLTERIRRKKHHFSPYLGLAQFTATIEFVDKKQAKLLENLTQKYIEIITAVNLSKINDENPIEFDYSAMYSANNMPVEMNRNREIQEYSEVIIEKNGQPIKAKIDNYYNIEKYGNILFL